MWYWWMKLPFMVTWNMMFLGIYTLQLVWRVKRHLWDPRTWLTVFLFYVAANVMLLFFQIFVDFLLLGLTGKTLTDFLPDLGNYISNYGLSSAVTTLLFTTLSMAPVVWLLRPGSEIKLLRSDVLEEIVRYNSEYILSRLKRGIILIIIGLLLGVLL